MVFVLEKKNNLRWKSKAMTQKLMGCGFNQMENQQETSVRHLSQPVELSLGTCYKILKKS